MPAAYSTATVPYPAAMWDEAAETLEAQRGWTTVLLVCPDPRGTEATAKAEMSARGVSNATALVVAEPFGRAHVLRISRLKYIYPGWDDVEDHLLGHSTSALLTFDTETYSADVMIEEARLAMAERGIKVGVGYAADPTSRMGILRIQKAS